jgi:hypothetical protein
MSDVSNPRPPEVSNPPKAPEVSGSESPKKKMVYGDPQTMKMMGYSGKGYSSNKRAKDSIAKTHDVRSPLDDKGKVKLDTEGKNIFKRLKDEQLNKPKGKRLTDKQLKAIVKALQDDQPLLSDNPTPSERQPGSAGNHAARDA